MQPVPFLLDQQPPTGLVRRHLHEVLDFALHHGARLPQLQAFWGEPHGGGIEWLDKVVLETALLCYVAQRATVGDSALAAKLRALAELMEPLARSPAYLQTILRNPQHVITYGMAHIALTAAGLPDAGFDYVVRRAVRTRQHQAAERIPFRDLDAMWLLQLYDSPAFEVSFERVAYGSILSADTSPLYLTRADAYAITHSIFYLTDFGRQPLPTAVNTPQLRQLLEETIAWNVLSGDLDLLGELLLCAWQTDPQFGPYAQLGLAYLFTSWHRLRGLVAPSFEPVHFETLTGEPREAYQFLHTYHTYYVGALLCATLCESDFTYELPAEIEVPAPGGPAYDLQALVAETFPDNTFLLPVVRATPLAAESKNDFLVDTLLIQAVREYDLSLLSRVYELMQRDELAPTPLTHRSLAYLELQQLPGGRYGTFAVGNATPEAQAASDWLAHCLHAMLAYCAAAEPVGC